MMALALEVSALSVLERACRFVQGKRPLWFLGVGGFFYFIIKILFVSIVPFSAPLGIA